MNTAPYFPFLYPPLNTSAGDYRFSPLQRRGKLQTSTGVGMVATIYSSAWVLSKIIIIFPLTAMMTDQTQTVVIFIDIL